jgi:hypothetical protein
MIEVLVKEMPISETETFIRENREQAWKSGCSLFSANSGGFRPWAGHELLAQALSNLSEDVWEEVWQVDILDPKAVFDVVKYTGFYSATTMVRFDEFEALALPVIIDFSGAVTRASDSGVSIYSRSLPEPAKMRAHCESAWEFNSRHFPCEGKKRDFIAASVKSRLVWYGPS